MLTITPKNTVIEFWLWRQGNIHIHIDCPTPFPSSSFPQFTGNGGLSPTSLYLLCSRDCPYLSFIVQTRTSLWVKGMLLILRPGQRTCTGAVLGELLSVLTLATLFLTLKLLGLSIWSWRLKGFRKSYFGRQKLNTILSCLSVLRILISWGKWMLLSDEEGGLIHRNTEEDSILIYSKWLALLCMFSKQYSEGHTWN